MTSRVLPSPMARPTQAVRNGWAPESSSPATAITCVRSSTDSSETEKLMVPPPVHGSFRLVEGYPVDPVLARRLPRAWRVGRRLPVHRLDVRMRHGVTARL